MFLEAQAEIGLSEKMIDLRLKAGLTQKQLADRLGVSQAYIGKLESGGYGKAGIATLRGIALALGYDLAIESMFLLRSDLRYAVRDAGDRNIIFHAPDHTEHSIAKKVIDFGAHRKQRIAAIG